RSAAVRRARAVGGHAAGGGVGRAGAGGLAAARVVAGAGAVGLDALGDQGRGRADDRGGLALGALHDAVVAGARDVVAEAGDEAVDHRGGEDREQDDGQAGDDRGERVGSVVGGQGPGETQHYDDDRLHQDHGDHDPGPAADVAPQVLVDEARVHDGAAQGADAQQGGPDDELQPQHAGGDDRHERHDDQHDRAAADVLALPRGAGGGAEGGVRLVAGRLRGHVGDAVGGGDDGVEDQRGELRGEHREPQEPSGFGEGGGEGDTSHRPLGDGQQPQQQGEDRR